MHSKNLLLAVLFFICDSIFVVCKIDYLNDVLTAKLSSNDVSNGLTVSLLNDKGAALKGSCSSLSKDNTHSPLSCICTLKKWLQHSPFQELTHTRDASGLHPFLNEQCQTQPLETIQLLKQWSRHGSSTVDVADALYRLAEANSVDQIITPDETSDHISSDNKVVYSTDIAELNTIALFDPISLVIPLALGSAYYGWRTHRTLRQEKQEERQKAILNQLQLQNARKQSEGLPSIQLNAVQSQRGMINPQLLRLQLQIQQNQLHQQHVHHQIQQQNLQHQIQQQHLQQQFQNQIQHQQLLNQRPQQFHNPNYTPQMRWVVTQDQIPIATQPFNLHSLFAHHVGPQHHVLVHETHS